MSMKGFVIGSWKTAHVLGAERKKIELRMPKEVHDTKTRV